MEYIKNNKDKIKEKNFWAFATIGAAVSLYIAKKMYNILLGNKVKALESDSFDNKRKFLISNRIKRLFKYENSFENTKLNKETGKSLVEKLKYMNIEVIKNKSLINSNILKTQTEIKYSKLIEFTNNVVNKPLNPDEIRKIKNNPQEKQDFIFYQILNGMKKRFDTKSEINNSNKFKSIADNDNDSKVNRKKDEEKEEDNQSVNEIEEEKLRIMKEYSKNYYNKEKSNANQIKTLTYNNILKDNNNNLRNNTKRPIRGNIMYN